MKVELRFRNTNQGDAIAYLRTAGAACDGGMVVRSEDDYEHLVRGVLGGTNRSREILITDSLEKARTVALLRRGDNAGEALISQIGDDIFAIGLTTGTGSYDDGMPLIYDLREYGRPLELQGSFDRMDDIHIEIANGPLELVESKIADPEIPAAVEDEELVMAI
jgi:hypothetical protein